MRERRLQRLFERFRTKGDVRALGIVFDEVAPELYRVAVHLARDLHTAEDLVQSTFLAAIESRERWNADRPLVPWLLGILARKAAYAQRANARTPDPDRLTTRSVDDPSRDSESRETHDMLVRLLEKTATPYREVLVMHLCEEKSAAEIARDLGRAPGTVRVQIHRGLEALRKQLPVGIATAVVASALAPRGLSLVRGSVVRAAHAAVASTAVHASAATVIAVTGGSVMKIAWIGAASAAVLCGAWLALREAPATTNAAVAVEHVASTSAPSSPERALATESAAAESSERTALSGALSKASHEKASVPALIAGETSLCARFLLGDGRAASSCFVALLRDDHGAPNEQVVVSANTADDGNVCLHAAPGSYFVCALIDGMQPWSTRVELADAPLALGDTTLVPGATIRGHVRLMGEPAPAKCELSIQCHAEGKRYVLGKSQLVWSHDKFLLQPHGTQTDAHGAFAWSGLDDELYTISLEQTPTARSIRASADVHAPNEHAELDFDLARLIVHVRSEEQPVRAVVQLMEGRFGPPVNKSDVDALVITGTMTSSASIDVPVSFGSTWAIGPMSDAEFLLPPESSCRIDVVADDFEPTGFSVSMPASGAFERTVELKPRADLGDISISFALPAGTHARDISQAGFGLFAAQVTDAVPRGTVDDTGTIAAAPHRANGRRSTRSWSMSVSSMGPTRRNADLVRNERSIDGAFHLQRIPAGQYDVVAIPNGTWTAEATDNGLWLHDSVHVEVTAGGVAHATIELRPAGRLRLRCDDRRGVHLAAKCEVFDASGKKLETSLFRWEKDRSSFWKGGENINASTPDGANDVFPNLPAGTYSVRFSLDGFVETTKTARVELGMTTEVDAVLDAK